MNTKDTNEKSHTNYYGLIVRRGINDIVQVGRMYGDINIVENQKLGDKVGVFDLYVGDSSNKVSVQLEQWYILGTERIKTASLYLKNGIVIALLGHRYMSYEADEKTGVEMLVSYNVVDTIDLLTVKALDEDMFNVRKKLKHYDEITN